MPSQCRAGSVPADVADGKQVLRWLLVGTGEIAGDFTRGLADESHSEVVAVAGSRPGRGDAFVQQWGLPASAAEDTLADALARDDVDAVYIATPHPTHEALALAAIKAGKAVLVEKPIAMEADSAKRIIDAAREHGVFLMEAYMYRCHPVIAELVRLIREGAIGPVKRLESDFCFRAPFDPGHRLFNPALGGGAILDVGGYPMSLAGLVSGCVEGKTYGQPTTITASGIVGESGVIEEARAELEYESGFQVALRCSIREDAGTAATVFGEHGSIRLPDPWLPGGDRHGRVSEIILNRDGQPAQTLPIRADADVYALEARVFSDALRRSSEPGFPAMGIADTLRNMRLIDAWRSLVFAGGGTDSPNLS